MSTFETRKRWYQYKLSSLLLFMLAISMVLGLLGRSVERLRGQARAATKLRALGAGIEYENDGPMHRLLRIPLDANSKQSHTSRQPPLPLRDRFMKKIGGDDWMKIKYVDLEGARFDDDSLSHLRGLCDLETLSIRDTKITGIGFRFLKEVPTLRRLIIVNFFRGRASLTEKGFEQLGMLSQLRDLSLELGCVTDADLVYLSGLRSLERLSLLANPVTDSGMKHVGQLTGLLDLCVQDTEITDRGLEYLNNLRKLEFLDVSGTRVTEKGIRTLKQFLPDLEIQCVSPAGQKKGSGVPVQRPFTTDEKEQ